MNLPEEVFQALMEEVGHVNFGVVQLELHIRDSKLSRFVLARERSFIPGCRMNQFDSTSEGVEERKSHPANSLVGTV